MVGFIDGRLVTGEDVGSGDGLLVGKGVGGLLGFGDGFLDALFVATFAVVPSHNSVEIMASTVVSPHNSVEIMASVVVSDGTVAGFSQNVTGTVLLVP